MAAGSGVAWVLAIAISFGSAIVSCPRSSVARDSLAVTVGSSRLYESPGRTAGFRIRSSVFNGACWVDQAVFAGVNLIGRDCMMALRFRPAREVFAGVNPIGERPYVGSRYSFR